MLIILLKYDAIIKTFIYKLYDCYIRLYHSNDICQPMNTSNYSSDFGTSSNELITITKISKIQPNMQFSIIANVIAGIDFRNNEILEYSPTANYEIKYKLK